MIFFILLIFLCLIGFCNFLIHKLKKDKKKKRNFYDFGDGNSIVYSIFILIFSFIAVNSFIDNPVFSDYSRQIEYGKKTFQPWLESDAYHQLLQTDTHNVDLNYDYVNSHFDPNQSMGPDVRKYNQEGTSIFDFYTKLSGDSNVKTSDIGNLFLGIYYFNRNDPSNAETYLKSVTNDKIKYLNTYLGRVKYYFGNQKEGKECLKKEIALKGDKKGAYYNLSLLYDFEKDYNNLGSLVYNSEAKPFIPHEFCQRIHIMKHDMRGYFSDLFSAVFKNTNAIGFIGAFLILCIWIMYLKRVDVYQRGRWGSLIFIILLSAIFVFPVWLLYDCYRYLMGFDLNGSPANDFFYCVFGIGVIEELVKVIPFLIILKFTKTIKEPIDYIMYASLSALGFAFVENFLYFKSEGLNLMHSRALTASVAHMIFSSLIAYGLVLAKFRYKKSATLFFFLFFFIASFAHGFYDFWLLNEAVSEYSIFTFLCLLTCILVYASITNNVLNNSMTLSDNIKLNTAKLSSDMAASLIIVFLFEFVCISLIYGHTIGNRELISSTLSGGYLILFLSIRLSNIDIIPGEWSRIEFFVGLLPMQVITGDIKPNFNSLVGLNINIRQFRNKGVLPIILPVDGEIIKREKISGFSGWFRVKLKSPIIFNKKQHEYILIRPKEQKLIEKGENTIIAFTIIPDIALLDNSNKKLKDFAFVDWAIAN